MSSPQRCGQSSKLARAFVVGDLLRSAKSAARTTKQNEELLAPHSVLREFLNSEQGPVRPSKQTSNSLAPASVVREFLNRVSARMRLPLRVLAGALGVLLFVHLIKQAGPARLLENILALRWGLGLIIALGGVSHLAKTWAWRLTLLAEKHRVSFARMFGLRLGSEAVGQLGILGQLFGETLRVSLLGSAIPLASGITSVTLDRALFTVGAGIVTTAGLLAALIVMPLPHILSLYAGLFVSALLGLILVTACAARKRWTVVSGTADLLGRVGYFKGWLDAKRSLIRSVENKLLDFYHHAPKAFWGSFALNLACHGMAVLEVYLTLWLAGFKVSLLDSLAVEALTKLVNIVGIFNPGNVGTYEGGNVFFAKMLGLSGTVGLTLALTRRIRALSWAAAGSLCLVVLSKARKYKPSRTSPAPLETQNKSVLTGRSHVAVILADDLHDVCNCESSLAEVGALPVVFRAIEGARKAGAQRIVVATHRGARARVQNHLQRTGRVPASLEWAQLGTSLVSLLDQIVRDANQSVVLICADRTYHPSLHRQATDWEGDSEALALMTGKDLVGIYVLTPALIADLARHAPSNLGCLRAHRGAGAPQCSQVSSPAPSLWATSLRELHAWLASTHTVECEQITQYHWQRVATSEDRLIAEQKLDRWLVKPTDGVFARLNRRISIPISRQIIRFPITPNMVSLFTLGVSFSSGLFYALGGYSNMLLGAILSLAASILDGCDGEVARLKLQESAFGCWLETVCDYRYYLFIFAGMTFGLWRTSGSRTFLNSGALLLFGAVMTFVVTSIQRHKLTHGRPEQLLGIWQRRAASRKSDLLLYIGRHTEFIIRRCFLPYALLFFALFNITQVAFMLCAFGANVAWIIALHSHRAFGAVQTSKESITPQASPLWIQ